MKDQKNNDNNSGQFKMVFDKSNYLFMILGLVLIVLGLFLLSGGKSNDPKVFDESIFNSQRLIVAPLLMLAGFVIEIFAIMKKTKS